MPHPLSPDDTALLLREADAAARRLLRRLRLPRHELDDLRQDLLTDLLARLPAYDPARSPLGAFAGVVLRHRAARLAEETARRRRLHGGAPVSLDEPLAESDGATRGDLVSEAEGLCAWHGQPTDAAAEVERRLDVERALGGLAAPLLRLCPGLAARPAAEVARRSGISRATLHRRVARLRLELLMQGLGWA